MLRRMGSSLNAKRVFGAKKFFQNRARGKLCFVKKVCYGLRSESETTHTALRNHGIGNQELREKKMKTTVNAENSLSKSVKNTRVLHYSLLETAGHEG
jgi:hypothetical protein